MRSPVRIASTICARPVRRRRCDRPQSTRCYVAGSVAGTPADATARIVAAAQALLTTLDDAGRAKVQFPFEGPQKTRWSNLPSPMFQREGLRLGDLTPAQRTAVMTPALDRAQSRRISEGDRHHARRRSAPDSSRGQVGRAGGGRGRGGARGGGGVRFGEDEYLPRLPGNAVGDGTVDVAVWRSSSRDQSDDGREPGDAWRRASPPLSPQPTRSKAGPSVRWATRTTRRLR